MPYEVFNMHLLFSDSTSFAFILNILNNTKHTCTTVVPSCVEKKNIDLVSLY